MFEVFTYFLNWLRSLFWKQGERERDLAGVSSSRVTLVTGGSRVPAKERLENSKYIDQEILMLKNMFRNGIDFGWTAE